VIDWAALIKETGEVLVASVIGGLGLRREETAR
jgi:hypothetical protein